MPKGDNPWNKGTKIDRTKYPNFGHFQKHTEETKEKMRKSHKGRTGKTNSEEHNRKVSLAQKGKPRPRGELAPRWAGGKTKLSKRIRASIEWKLWRASVFERDNYTCQMCTKRGVRLEPHHIKKFADYPKLRFDIDNGITLCIECHQPTKCHEEEYEEIFYKHSPTISRMV